MIAQYTQAGIVSELKRLANPASADSIPSSAMQEDHVSMGWSAARKLRRAIDLKGFRFLHVLSPCPTGWKSEPAMGMELVRLAVRSGLYPVIEIFDGKRYVVNIEPDFSDEALDMYLSLQLRFQKSGISAAGLRPAIDRHWQELRALSGRIVPARRVA